MTEIPEHLLKRAKEAKERAAASSGDAAPAASGADAGAQTPEQAAAASKIPQHLLDRAKAARSASAGTAVEAAAPAAATAAGGAVATAAPNAPTGPGGHTQRLLTVVKSGSIQDVKSAPVDKVHVVAASARCRVCCRTCRYCVLADLLDLRKRTTARACRLQCHAEPIQGPVVLPGSAGTAHYVPPHGGWCDTAWLRTHPADPGAVHRQEPIEQA